MRVERDQLAVAMALEYRCEHELVFLGQDRAGGIDERAAAFEHGEAAVEQRALRTGHLREQLLGDALLRFGIACAHGARAGAGGV